MSQLTLDNIYPMKKASSYSAPRSASAVVPELWGDLTENSGANPITQCVSLNTTYFVHGISGRAVLSTANGNTFRFWDGDGTEITSSHFTVNPAVDYEGQGTIATVTFDADYGDVSCQCMGAVNADGALITNPVEMFEALVGGTAAIHRASFNKARLIANTLGYRAAGAITSEYAYSVWLTNLATSFLMDYYISADDSLKIRLDSSIMLGLQPAFALVERDTTHVEVFDDVDDILNQVPAYYAPTYAVTDRRFREGVNVNYLKYEDGESTKDVNSQRRYGIRNYLDTRPAYEFDWCRHLPSVQIVQARLVERFAHPFWRIQWDEYSKQAIYAEVGDLGIYSWKDRIDEEGNPMTDRYVQVLEETIPLTDGGLRMYLRETNIRYDPTVRYWDGTSTLGESGFYW